jgi:hypothetical protein
MLWKSIFTGWLVILLVAACVPGVPAGPNETAQTPLTETQLPNTAIAGSSATAVTPSPDPGQPTPALTGTATQPTAYDPALEAYVQLAKEDLAARLGLSTGAIQVIEARSVVWPDGSLGCPHPGMSYIQVPQDGALIRLSAAGITYNYHSGGNKPPFLCEQTFQAKETPILLDTYVPTPGNLDE